MPTKLVKLKMYEGPRFKKLSLQIERLSSDETKQMATIVAISDWTNKGIDAPTALESAGGWYRHFNDGFIAVGNGGSVFIDDIAPTYRNRYAIPGKVDLDAWKPEPPKPKESSLDEGWIDSWLE